jgi:hypothetical protein
MRRIRYLCREGDGGRDLQGPTQGTRVPKGDDDMSPRTNGRGASLTCLLSRLTTREVGCCGTNAAKSAYLNGITQSVEGLRRWCRVHHLTMDLGELAPAKLKHDGGHSDIVGRPLAKKYGVRSG